MQILSQHDPRWAADHLGPSNLTVSGYGCTTCCISMLSDYFKCYKSPKDIAHNAANYTPVGHPQGPGLIVWNNLKFDKMKFVWRDYGEKPEKIADAMKDPDKAVMLQVHNGAHWVVALRPPYFFEGHKGDYWVADPWTGTKTWAKARYFNITGAAYFARS